MVYVVPPLYGLKGHPAWPLEIQYRRHKGSIKRLGSTAPYIIQAQQDLRNKEGVVAATQPDELSPWSSSMNNCPTQTVIFMSFTLSAAQSCLQKLNSWRCQLCLFKNKYDRSFGAYNVFSLITTHCKLVASVQARAEVYPWQTNRFKFWRSPSNMMKCFPPHPLLQALYLLQQKGVGTLPSHSPAGLRMSV